LITNWNTVPAETLAALLKENVNLNGMPFFAMYSDNWLTLEGWAATDSVTPEMLRDDVGVLIDVATRTITLWSPMALGQSPSN